MSPLRPSAFGCSPSTRSRSASGRTTALSFALWLRAVALLRLRRYDAEPDGAKAGPAFQAGVYTEGKGTMGQVGVLEKAADRYQIIDLGVPAPNQTMYIWVAPIKDATTAAFVDRFFFVRK